MAAEVTEHSTKDRILHSAGEIFAAKGFADATVREICDSAGVNVASVNYYFGDKQSLYFEAVMAARASRVQQHPMPVWSQGISPEDRLFVFVETLLKRLVVTESASWQARLMSREILHPSEACRAMVETYFRPVFDVLIEIVHELSFEKPTREQANRIGFSIIGQCLYYRFSSELMDVFLGDEATSEAYQIPQLTEHIYQFSLNAIQNMNRNPMIRPHVRTVPIPPKTSFSKLESADKPTG